MASHSVPDVVLSHWSTLIEGFQASPLAFYTAVEEALLRRQIPQTRNSRVDYKETGLLGANREYLRVQREKLTFDICAAPFGTGFFVSWWFTEDRPTLNAFAKAGALLGMLLVALFFWNQTGIIIGSIVFVGLVVGALAVAQSMAASGDASDAVILELPILGWIYRKLFKSDTFYRFDSMQMFQQAVHNAVVEVIDNLTMAQGIRTLSESERKPILREFYARSA